jgi:hypothetical protein
MIDMPAAIDSAPSISNGAMSGSGWRSRGQA